MTAPDTIPEGYRRDPQGRLVPEALIKPIDLTRDALVQELAVKFKEERSRLMELKRRAFDDIEAFVQLSAEQYGVRLGGKKGNVTLMSFDGQYKMVRQIQETIRFDERLQAAKSLVDECLADWIVGARDELRVIANDAFQVDKEGNIRTGKVLSLRRWRFDDERWQRAMQIISDAVHVVGSKAYVRAYERDAQGKYQPISLDMAGV